MSVHVKTLTKHRASLAAPMVCSITIIKRFCVSYWLVQITQCCTFMKLDYHLFRFHEWATLGHLDQSIVNTNKSLDYSVTRLNSEPTGTVILSDLNRYPRTGGHAWPAGSMSIQHLWFLFGFIIWTQTPLRAPCSAFWWNLSVQTTTSPWSEQEGKSVYGGTWHIKNQKLG